MKPIDIVMLKRRKKVKEEEKNVKRSRRSRVSAALERWRNCCDVARDIKMMRKEDQIESEGGGGGVVEERGDEMERVNEMWWRGWSFGFNDEEVEKRCKKRGGETEG